MSLGISSLKGGKGLSQWIWGYCPFCLQRVTTPRNSHVAPCLVNLCWRGALSTQGLSQTIMFHGMVGKIITFCVIKIYFITVHQQNKIAVSQSFVWFLWIHQIIIITDILMSHGVQKKKKIRFCFSYVTWSSDDVDADQLPLQPHYHSNIIVFW